MEKKQDKMRPKKSVNLQTIADAVGVSVVSVSNALSGKPGLRLPEIGEMLSIWGGKGRFCDCQNLV